MPFEILDKKEGYLIHEVNGKYYLCKIIETYDSQEEAVNELVKAITKNK